MAKAKSISRERYAFDRAATKALAAQVKGTAWKNARTPPRRRASPRLLRSLLH